MLWAPLRNRRDSRNNSPPYNERAKGAPDHFLQMSPAHSPGEGFCHDSAKACCLIGGN
jgi:hypothetical protein